MSDVQKHSQQVSISRHLCHHQCLDCDASCLTCVQGSPTTCLSCPSSKFLSKAKCVNACPSGQIAEESLCKGARTVDENLCEPGTFNALKGQSSSTSCSDCGPGKYCAGFKGTSQNNCDAGYYCTSNAAYAKNHDEVNGIGTSNSSGGICNQGYYCPSGSSAPIICDIGKYCQTKGLATVTGNCLAGYQCQAGSTSPTPKQCPVGHYCPSGQAAQRCPIGTYLEYQGATRLKECRDCDPGFFCNARGASAVTGQCDAGYYCSGGAQSANQNVCPKGYKCPAGSRSPTPCALSEYQDSQGQSTCKSCTAGYYCTQTQIIICPAGYYCLANNVRKPCPIGTFRSSVQGTQLSDCSNCPAGYACMSRAMTNGLVKSCAPGYYCSGKATTDMPRSSAQGGDICSKGFYCPQRSSAPISCDAGKYCPNEGAVLPAGACQPGYYCSGGSSTSIPTGSGGNICPVGRYCPGGSSAPQNCPIPSSQYINYEGADDSGDCLQCPAGKTCADGQIAGVDCAAGFYCDHDGTRFPCNRGHKCPQGSRDQIPCQPGEYQPNTQQSVCLTCPAGQHCQGLNVVSPKDCPDGYYCLAGTYSQHQYPCPPGYRGKGQGLGSQAAACQLCDAGQFCPKYGMIATDTLPCNAGFFCIEGSKVPAPNSSSDSIGGLTKAGPCPAGHYCSQGVSAGTECPHGTFRPYTGGRQLGDCIQVPIGKFSTQTGLVNLPLTASSQYGDCAGGYICTGGSYSKTPQFSTIGKVCPVGHHCPEGATIEIACKPGWYQKNTQQSTCVICQDGTYCPDFGTVEPKPCPKGSYCKKITAQTDGPTVPTPCPRGTYNPNSSSVNSDACLPCPVGKYCPDFGMESVTENCRAGHICVSGSDIPNPQAQDYSSINTVNGLCPKGFSCTSGAFTPSQCQPGFFNPSFGQSVCIDCPPGFFCNAVAMTTVSTGQQCSAGYYCTGQSRIATQVLCPVKKQCEKGSAFSFQCEDGTFQPLAGQGTCTQCQQGKLCRESQVFDCNQRRYCPAGKGYGVLCDNGYFKTQSSHNSYQNSQCNICSQNKFCMAGSQIGPCQRGHNCLFGAAEPAPKSLSGGAFLCPYQHYCLPDTNPIKCDPNKYTQNRGSIQVSDCVTCPLGKLCNGQSQSDCPLGFYCQGGLSKSCPVTTLRDQQAVNQQKAQGRYLVDCIPCPAGFFCNTQGIADRLTKKCRAGYYCVAKATREIACPKGTYSLEGSSSRSDCKPCPSGYYCGQATSNPILCQDNYFCNQSTTQQPCPAGYQCKIVNNDQPSSKFTKKMSKTLCPQGSYCQYGNAGPQKCSDDKFCPLGSQYEQPCNINSATNSCNQCMPGQFRFGINSCSPCPAGYICLGNTTTKFPINRATDNGFECPKGNYCPQSSSKQIPCPIGTHNPSKLGTSIESCIPCPEGTYNDVTGQYQCQSCGPFATSDSTKTTCICSGAFRIFGKEDGSCRCQTGYTFETERGQNSANNCEPIQLKANCSFDHVGRCSFSCQTQCGQSLGTLTNAGICQCDANADSAQACDANCQNQFLKVTITPALQIRITLPSTGQSVMFQLASESSIFGQPNCSASAECDLISTISGGETSYQPDTYFVDKFKARYPLYQSPVRTLRQNQRNLQTQAKTSFNSPIFCLTPGTTVSFDTSRGNYPVYLKDSFLNTNKSFDYSQFTVLGSRISQGRANIQTFYYTFSSQGVYVFEDSNNKGYKYIYKISSSQCSTQNRIQQLSNASLASLNIIQDSSRINQQIAFIPNILIIIVLQIFLAMVASMFLAKCLKLDRYDFQIIKDKGGIDHSKAANDVRLLAVKRKLQEMIRYIQDAEGKSHKKGEEFEKQNMEKVDKFEREIEMLLQSMGLQYDEAGDLLDGLSDDMQDSSDRTSRLSSQGSGENKKFRPGEEKDVQEISKIQSNFRDEEEQKAEQNMEKEEDDSDLNFGDDGDYQNLLVRNDLPQEHKDFINKASTRRQIQNKKAEFEAQLRKQGLSDDDKRKQIDEFQNGIKNLQKQLQEDQQKQKNFLLAQLRLRKDNRNDKDVQKLAQIQEKEKQIREKHQQEQKQLFNQLSQQERLIQNDYDKQLKDLKRAEIRQKNESLKKFKADFNQKKLSVKDPNQIRRLQEEHQRQYKEFLEIMEKEQQEQNKDNYAKLLLRKQKRLEKAKAKYDKSAQQLEADQNSQMLKEVLEEKMQLQIGLGDDQDKADIFALQNDEEKKSLEAQQKLQRKVQLEYLKNQQNIDKNLMENNFKQQEQQMIEQMENRQLALPSEEELQNKRADFKQKLNNASSEAERKKLMRQLEIEEQKLATALDLEKRDQQHALKKRKLQIQQRKQLKLLEMEREQDKQRNIKEIQILEEQDNQRESEEIKRVYKIIEESLLKTKVGEPKLDRRQLPGAVDSFLNQFNTEQLKNLINRQFLELSRQLAGLLASNQNYKIHQIKFARENFANRRLEIFQKRGLTPDRKQVLVEQLKKQENEAVNDIDAKYKLKQMDDQGKLRSKLAKKHAQDKDNLKQRQFEGKSTLLDDIIQKYGGNDPDTLIFLEKMKQKLLQSSAQEMREFSANVKKEREQNLEEIKKKLFFDNEQQLASFEENFEKELDEERKRIDQKLKNEKKDMILKRKASFEERLKRMEGMAQANIDLYMEEHQQNLKRLEDALDNEREKQHNNIKQKIKLRKLKQLKRAALEKEKQRMKQLQESKLQKQKSAILFVAEKAMQIKQKREKQLQKKKEEQQRKRPELVINPNQSEIDYKAMVKQWANRVQLHPPEIGEMQNNNTFDHQMEDSTMEYGIFADLDAPIKRGSSHRTEFHDDQLMQRVIKIDKMVRSLVKN